MLPVGTDVTFTVTVTNAGPSAATGVELTDRYRPGWPGQCDAVAGHVHPDTGVWAIGALAVEAQTTLTLRATVQQPGALPNRAAKTAQGELDPNPKRRQRGHRQRAGGGCAGGQNGRPDHAAGGRTVTFRSR